MVKCGVKSTPAARYRTRNKPIKFNDMKKEWKLFVAESCPNCGESLEVLSACLEGDDTDFEQFFMDGDDVRCMVGCGFLSSMSADGEHAWVQDGNINELPDAEEGGEE